MMQSQTTWKEGSLTLQKCRNLSPSCLAFCGVSPYHSSKQMVSTRLVVLHGQENCQLSSSWSWSNAVVATRFHHFGEYKVFLCLLTYSHINVLWTSIRGSILCNLSISNPVYVSCSIMYGFSMPMGHSQHLLISASVRTGVGLTGTNKEP